VFSVAPEHLLAVPEDEGAPRFRFAAARVPAEREQALQDTLAGEFPNVTVIRSEGLNVYDVLRHQSMLVTRGALEALQSRLAGAAGAGAAGGDR